MSRLLLVTADDTLRTSARSISRRDDPTPGSQLASGPVAPGSPRLAFGASPLSPRNASSDRLAGGERKFSLGSQREADMRSKQDQLQHGETEVKEKSKPEPAVRRAEDDAYIALKRILLQPSAKVILAACDALAESEQYEKFLGAAVRLFHANDRILPLMKLMVTREVMYTLDPSTLFRQDSIATKLLSVYAKEVGMVYLQLDPLKLVEGANAEANAENLQAVVTDFLQSIYAQTVNCPPGFREMAGCLQEEVGSKFPSFKTQAVAGFLFLRFLCPAMLNPKGYGIMEETPNRPEFRALILVSKIVQQLANGARPGKQDFMQVMESYITTKLSEMTEFLYAYAATTTTTHTTQVKSEIREVDEVSPSVTQVEKEALDVLQKVMKYNIHKIGRVIVTSNEQRKSWRKNVADNAEKQGYLKKKGEISVTSSWRTRWFVLKNRFLYYFKSPQHSTSAGAIPLGKCTVKAVELEAKDKDKDSQEFCFEIVTNYRTYCLMAATESERLKWIEAIEAKIKSTETVPLSPVVAPPSSVAQLAQSLTPLSTSGSSITTAKKGYLIKRGNMVKNWKKRWFVLKDHLLFYYKTHTDP
ncbi:PH domain containing protein [Acanthamoeba castellanii str. Neff]|uniref:PH domain containing protein n=1 Tax=Acanthamoeba castellanii (strain ATCC 30010 / Neff) TaxID=1257118 RepID=L8GK59_ACACF|nr:PH domain containing protein [Acanthamoeba castellanii str. Neff]ELR12571.1 PH domain containing protein [Acanthamoeba castellanii str. Neff]